jgi:hypothetical protein
MSTTAQSTTQQLRATMPQDYSAFVRVSTQSHGGQR